MNSALSKPAKLFILPLGITLLASLAYSTAFAQIPPSTEPGAVIKSLEEKERPRSRLEDVVTVPKMDERAAPASAQKIFDLKRVVLDHAQAYKTGDFADIYGKYIGQRVSFADLNNIAREMTRKYREDGYIFSRVIVPPQKVTDGTVHFQAVEGRITNVEIVGNYKDENGLIKKIADRIRTSGPASTKQIERSLLLIDDLPGITARSFVKPSQTPGGGDLIISVEQDDFEGAASFDNRGSRYLGPYRGELVGAFNNALGMHDRTTLRALVATQTDELKYGEVSHEEQIGDDGAHFNGRFAVTDSAPGGNVTSLGIEGSSKLLDLSVTYPVIRGRQMNFNMGGGLTGLNSKTDLLGITTGEDRVRYVQLSSHLDFTDSLRGVNQFDLQVAKGLNALGATSEGTGRSRANGEQNFLRGNLTATRIQDLWRRDLSLFLSASGQAANDPMLASEEFGVGGSSFGRAYDGGEISGDRGYAGVAELRWNGPVDHNYVQSYQLYTFLDGGRVFNLGPAVGETGVASLASAGVGVRFNLIHNVSGYFELDSPLTRNVRAEGSDHSRLFFNLLKRF